MVILLFGLSSCVKQNQSSQLPSKVIAGNMLETSYESLNNEQKELLDEARKAMDKSYAPYSHFHVGSALRSFSGEIVTGTNVENAAYSPGICAERSALARANILGETKVKTIAIIGKGDDFNTEDVVAPCGVCRQVIYEAAQRSNHDIEIIMSNTVSDKVIVSKISDLLPLAFGPKDIGIEIE
jgi:cytidine deaminase